MTEPIEIKEPGIYDDLTNEEYHSTVAMSPLTGKLEPIISKSGLARGARSWAHYKSSIDFPMSPTPAMQFGTDCHTCVLEYDRWKEEKQAWFDTHIVKPSFSGKGSVERRKAWEEANSGKEALTWAAYEKKKHHFKKIERVRKSVFDLPEAMELLSSGIAEISAFHFDEELQVWMKCRPDLIRPDGHYIEFKTTTDTREYKFRYLAGDLHYHWHVMYLDILTAVTGYKHDKMTIIAVEAERPHLVNVFPIKPFLNQRGRLIDPLLVGRIQVQDMLKQYAECLKTDTWPGYPINDEPLKFSERSMYVGDEQWNEYHEDIGEGVEIDFNYDYDESEAEL